METSGTVKFKLFNFAKAWFEPVGEPVKFS